MFTLHCILDDVNYKRQRLQRQMRFSAEENWYFISGLQLHFLSPLSLCFLHASVIKKQWDTQALVNNIINHSHRSLQNHSIHLCLGQWGGCLHCLMTLREEMVSFCSLTTPLLCTGAQYCTELTRLHHLVILTQFFFHFFGTDLVFPLAFI